MANSIVLEMRGVCKTFGSTVALNDVSLQLRSNEIHGLLGGNGAGKTTLMNILYGLYKPDGGEIFMRGESIDIHSPKDAIEHGIGMVHQHFLQVNTFTVTQNVVLGTPVQQGLRLNLEREEERLRELAERFGLEVDPCAYIEDVPIGVRQQVEILKALYRNVEVLILDEPTTNLTPQQVDELFESLQVMVDAGMSVVFITHKLGEVMAVCDRITVLREGHNVVTVPRDEADEELLVSAMIGEELDVEESLLFSHSGMDEQLPERVGPAILQVEGLTVVNSEGNRVVVDCSFQVHGGEIFGIAGVAGNGQEELAEALLAIRPIAEGKAQIAGQAVTEHKTRELLDLEVSYVPADRMEDGFLPGANVAQNLILGYQRQRPYSQDGFLNWKAIFRSARDMIIEYDIKTPGPGETAANLSGGNIQRLLLARAFSHPSKLLIAHNPARGLDIRSVEFIYRKLLDLKRQGMATLLISEDLDELLLLSDRIATLYRGGIVGTLERPDFDKYAIGRLMSGVNTSE